MKMHEKINNNTYNSSKSTLFPVFDLLEILLNFRQYIRPIL